MKKSNSYLNYKYISNGVRPKLTKNPWLTNSSTASDYKYIRGEKFLPRNYMILNRDKLKNIENNYFDMRYLLNDKINRLEKNQRRFNEILKYSLEQNRMQNDINSFNYNKHMQNYEDKNRVEKDYLLKMINQMPEMIENKIDRIFQDEYESSQNQKNFIENLKERMLSEIKNQRRYDYMRYRQQLKELMILKENEEKEKLRLLNEIQQQKLKYKIREMKYQNGMNRYNNYNNPFYGFPPILPPMYPINAPTPQNNNSIGSSIDEFMKVFLFKEMMEVYKSIMIIKIICLIFFLICILVLKIWMVSENIKDIKIEIDQDKKIVFISQKCLTIIKTMVAMVIIHLMIVNFLL